MKLTSVIIILASCIFSCDSNTAKIKNENINHSSDSDLSYKKKEKKSKLHDTFRRIVVDDVLVKDEMLKSGYSDYKIKSGSTISYDKVWFSNDTLNQTLVVGLYTDGFRNNIFLFQNKNIPTELMKTLGLVSSTGDFVNLQVLKKDFNGFVSKSSKINTGFFTTKKGFKIGDPLSKAINVYGEPDSVKFVNGVNECEWIFKGDISFNGNADLKGKPLAKESYGHQVIMYFKNNKLIGLILVNEVP